MHTNATTEEYLLPPVEALLAGTLALMTGLAQSSDSEDPARERMQAKVRDNLVELSTHPHVSDNLRCMIVRLVGHWNAMPGTNRTAARVPGHPGSSSWLH